MTKQEGDNNNNNIDSTSPSILKEQRQIVLNLYNSGIESEVIAYQLDIGQEEVNRVIEGEEEEKKMKKKKKLTGTTLFYSPPIVSFELGFFSVCCC